MTQTAPPADRAVPDRPDPRELRVAVVLNGGVSLAVWIGGVTHEIDRLRRAGAGVARRGDAPPRALRQPAPRPVRARDLADVGPYRAALTAAGLRGGARVDVIAGASAGGINGAALAAAIQGTHLEGDRTVLRPLGTGRGSLRDVWLDLGDIGRLLRGVREPDPPSLLRGDEYIVGRLADVVGGLLVDRTAIDHPLYLYVTATDLRGRREAAFSTDSRERIRERDHRVVFRFAANAGETLGGDAASPAEGELADEMDLTRANALRLARVARASSSFPGAFPPHEAVVRRPPERWDDPDGVRRVRLHLADGGLLDNQPMRPVLDRITLMPVTIPWRRVVLFVVPYVGHRAVDAGDEAPPSIAEVVGASGLARDLPKLESLQRIEEARRAGRWAPPPPGPLDPATDDLVEAARRLHPLYLRTALAEWRTLAETWRTSPPGWGTSPEGRPEAASVERQARPAGGPASADPALEVLLPPGGWADAVHPAAAARWGPAAVERFSQTALSWLGGLGAVPGREMLEQVARHAASELTLAARDALAAHRRAYTDHLRAWARANRTRLQDGLVPEDVAGRAFVEASRVWTDAGPALAGRVDELLDVLGAMTGLAPGDLMERLAAVEVAGRALGDRTPRTPRFEFFRITAQGRVLGHRAETPEDKLAGMQLGHFAAFLKRSWRASDWMWGRLDGVRVLAEVLGRDDVWVRQVQTEILREELPALARAIDADRDEGFSVTGVAARWRERHRDVLDGRSPGDDASRDAALLEAFLDWDLDRENLIGDELGARATVSRITRMAAVATRALSGAASGLPAPVRGAVAVTRGTARFVDAVTQTVARWPQLGLAAVILLAALAGVLVSGEAIGASWLVPVLAAVAVAAGWLGYGYLSAPPAWWRVVVLGAALAALIGANLAAGVPDPGDPGGDAWEWIASAVAALAAAAAAVLLVLFAASVPVRALRWRPAPRPRRLGLGVALLVLLAVWLVRRAVTWIDERACPGGAGTCPEAAWEEFFTSREVLLTVLVLGVGAGVLTAALELLATIRAAPDWSGPPPPAGRGAEEPPVRTGHD